MATRKTTECGLSDRRAVFVSEYCKDFNGSRAAAAAGYAPKNARSTAYKLLQEAEIQLAISKEVNSRVKDNRVTADRVLRELANIAFADVRNACSFWPGGFTFKPSDEIEDDHAAAIAEVRHTDTKHGASSSIKMHGKVQALDLLGKHLGLWTDQIDISAVQADANAKLLADIAKVYGDGSDPVHSGS